MTTERDRALQTALGQIERAHGKGAIMRLGEVQAQPIDVIPTGALTLDIALGVGGVPRGRIIEVYGPEFPGKTTLTLHIIAEAQKRGGVAAFIDAEHALDPLYASRIGVRTEELLVQRDGLRRLGQHVSITAGVANVNGGNDIAKIGMSDVGSPTAFSVNNYTVTDLLLPTNGSTVFGSAGVLFIDTPVASATGAAVNISDNGSGTPDALCLGNVNSSFDVANVGVATVEINALTPTTITDNGHGLFLIGGTNVTNLNAQSTSDLFMDAPATGGGVNSGFVSTGATAGSAGNAGTPFFENPILNYGITVNGATGGGDMLQGVSGPLTAGLVNAAYIGGVGSSSITGSNVGGDFIFPEGGNTTVTLGAGHGTSDTVAFGFYALGLNTIVDQAITDIHNGGEIGVNAYLGALSNVTTINNFKIGATGDVIIFGPNDWVGTSGFVALASGGGDYGLWTAGVTGPVVPGASALKLVTAPDTPIATAVSVTLDGISTYTGAAQLQSQLVLAGVGDLHFGGGALDGHNIIHELVAYQVTGTNNINIADVELLNTTSAAQSGDTANPNIQVSVHDLVHLVGVGLLSNLNTVNFVFHA